MLKVSEMFVGTIVTCDACVEAVIVDSRLVFDQNRNKQQKLCKLYILNLILSFK